ncbi:MAG: NAD(P)-dependent oxidoreductase [Pseudomonadota bacterium]
MQLAFIGLGIMGYPMAGHLARQGHDVRVWNRTAEKSARWQAEYGGQVAASASAAARDADIVFTCVGNDDDLRAVSSAPRGAFDGMKTDAVLVDHSTTSAAVARELSAVAAQRGLHFVDAPVSGGQQGAVNGKLTVMCGTDRNDIFTRVAPVIGSYARAVQHMGPAGSGQLTKMANQITICGLIQSLSEAMLFAEKAGLDVQQVIDVISKGAAQSWQMENRHKTMIAGEYAHGFAVELMRKDLGIVFDEARRNGTSLPVAALVDQFYADVQQMGGSRWDTSSLLARLKKLDNP